jgi:Domain of unknown function (DUF4157)
MEQRFGRDFSHVRVHTDAKAAESAGVVSARAYTVGHHIAFGVGEFQPTTLTGRGLLTHELAHVMQQSGTAGVPASDTGAEREAQRAAQHVAAGLTPSVRVSARLGLQREPTPVERDREWARRLQATLGRDPYELKTQMGISMLVTMEAFAKGLREWGVLDANFVAKPEFAPDRAKADSAPAPTYSGPSVGPLSKEAWDRGQEEGKRRDAAKYREEHPNSYDIMAADNARLARAVDPSGSGIVKGAAKGAYLLAGQSLEEAEAHAQRVEVVAQVGAMAVSVSGARGSASQAALDTLPTGARPLTQWGAPTHGSPPVAARAGVDAPVVSVGTTTQAGPADAPRAGAQTRPVPPPAAQPPVAAPAVEARPSAAGPARQSAVEPPPPKVEATRPPAVEPPPRAARARLKELSPEDLAQTRARRAQADTELARRRAAPGPKREGLPSGWDYERFPNGPSSRWRPGDAVNVPDGAGNYPDWDTIRERIWRTKASDELAARSHSASASAGSHDPIGDLTVPELTETAQTGKMPKRVGAEIEHERIPQRMGRLLKDVGLDATQADVLSLKGDPSNLEPTTKEWHAVGDTRAREINPNRNPTLKASLDDREQFPLGKASNAEIGKIVDAVDRAGIDLDSSEAGLRLREVLRVEKGRRGASATWRVP